MDTFLFSLKDRLKPAAKLFPGARNFFISVNSRMSAYYLKKNILGYYGKMDPEEIDPEIKQIVEYLRHNAFNLFPYEFTKNYPPADVKVFLDEEKGMRYALWEDKKIYFRKRCGDEDVQRLFSALAMVQDAGSPHQYLDEEFNVSENDIVADLGAAEGEFSLSVIEKVKKIYLFEADPELQEALRATFEPWKEKVVIVSKYVSDKDKEKYVTLDSFFKDREKPTFLKIDIEGAEYDAIQGAKQLLSSPASMKVIIASYHKHGDEKILAEELRKYGFNTEYTKGYMLSLWDGVLKEPYVRRALIRARKND